MRIWPVQDAKARFSELIEACSKEGPQLVTKRGIEAAVVVPAAEWHRLTAQSRPTLKELLLSPQARFEFEAPTRGIAKRRKLPHF